MNERPSEDPVLRGALFRPILTYADAIDSKRFDLLKDVFAAEASLDFGGGAASQPVEEIVASMAEIHRSLTGSQHRLTNFFVDSFDEDTATTRTYGDALLVGGGAARSTYRDIGIYHDALVLTDGRWLITSRQYKSLWNEGDSAAVLAPPSEP